MKIIHQKVEAYPSRIRLPVDYLKISDPNYEEGVWCRYEKDNIQMDSIQVMVKHETMYDEQEDYSYDYGELIVSLSNRYWKGEPTAEKEYEMDETEFILNVLRTMNIHHLHLCVVRDEDVDINMDNEELFEDMQMSP